MGDHHQVKTSFLFIQLQSPSKACGAPHPANTACTDAAEEGLSPTPASDAESLRLGEPTKSSPVNAPRSHADGVSHRSGEGTPESAIRPSETPTGNAKPVAGDPQDQENLRLSAERLDVGCEDTGNPLLETPVWIPRQDTPESMSGEIGSLVAEMGVTSPAVPSQPGARGRVSFLHPAAGSGPSHKTFPGADSVLWGEESSKQSWAKGPAICKSAESKTFLSAVIERSAKIPGEPYKKKVDRSSSMPSPGPETPAAAEPAPEPSATASAEPLPSTTDGPSPHLPPTAAQKVSLRIICHKYVYGAICLDFDNAHS